MRVFTPLTAPNFVWNRVSRLVQKRKFIRAIELASAHFFLRSVINTKWYIGIDVNTESLKRGIDQWTDDKSFGLQSSMMSEPLIPNYGDLVISTYTLLYIPADKRIKAIQNLIDWTAPGGLLIFSLPLTSPMDHIQSLVRDNFENVTVTYYHSFLSHWYQRRIFPRLRKRKIDVPKWMTRMLTILFEYGVPNRPNWNRKAIVTAQAKKLSSDLTTQIDLVERLGYRLFRDLRCPQIKSFEYDVTMDEFYDYFLNWLREKNGESASLNSIGIVSARQDQSISEDEMIKMKEVCDAFFEEAVVGSTSILTSNSFDVLVVWDYRGSDQTFFHHEVYQAAKDTIFLTYPKEMRDRVAQQFR